MKSLLRIALLLTLILTINLPTTCLAEAGLALNVTSTADQDPFACLSRFQKERVANCFDELKICDDYNRSVEQPSWISVTEYGGAGLLLGLIVGLSLGHR
jgi:hypothetical protein